MKKDNLTLLKKIKHTALIFISIFLLFSCENSENTDENLNLSNNKHNISKEKAIDAAQVFLEKYHTSRQETSKENFDIIKTIQSVYTFKTISDKNVFYAINYEEGGFVVVSADDRVSPIRAFCEEGKFSNNVDEIPDPVVSWLEDEKESMEYIKDNNITQIPEIKTEWDYLDKTISSNSICNNIIYQKGPLMATRWGQGEGFNNLIPYTCSDNPFNHTGRAFTGCVATAMSQVLKYHHKPSSWSYSDMSNDVGNIHTQSLMYSVGLSVDMNYGCTVSGANAANMAPSFINTFGYSSAIYVPGYDADIVYGQIAVNRPVILTGGRKTNGITYPWNYFSDGHAWVSDGYLFVILRTPDAAGNCQSLGFRFLYMNWGWYGSHNGWFNENNFNPNNNTYNYKRGMLFNIIP